MSSTCSAMFGYQSDTHMPLCPYCFHCGVDAISVLLRRARDVCAGFPIESGMGLPSSFVEQRLRIEQIDVAGSAFHEQQDHRLRRRLDGAASWAAEDRASRCGRHNRPR